MILVIFKIKFQKMEVYFNFSERYHSSNIIEIISINISTMHLYYISLIYSKYFTLNHTMIVLDLLLSIHCKWLYRLYFVNKQLLCCSATVIKDLQGHITDQW